MRVVFSFVVKIAAGRAHAAAGNGRSLPRCKVTAKCRDCKTIGFVFCHQFTSSGRSGHWADASEPPSAALCLAGLASQQRPARLNAAPQARQHHRRRHAKPTRLAGRHRAKAVPPLTYYCFLAFAPAGFNSAESGEIEIGRPPWAGEKAERHRRISKTCRSATQNGTFQNAKRGVLDCKTARFAGRFCKENALSGRIFAQNWGFAIAQTGRQGT